MFIFLIQIVIMFSLYDFLQYTFIRSDADAPGGTPIMQQPVLV